MQNQVYHANNYQDKQQPEDEADDDEMRQLALGEIALPVAIALDAEES